MQATEVLEYVASLRVGERFVFSEMDLRYIFSSGPVH